MSGLCLPTKNRTNMKDYKSILPYRYTQALLVSTLSIVLSFSFSIVAALRILAYISSLGSSLPPPLLSQNLPLAAPL